MKTLQDLLKISGLLFLLPGTMMVVFPDQIIEFLNGTESIPKVLILITGIGFNLSGLLILHFSKQKTIAKTRKSILLIILIFWIFTVVLALLQGTWVNSVNAITMLGLWLIVMSWLSWHIFQNK